MAAAMIFKFHTSLVFLKTASSTGSGLFLLEIMHMFEVFLRFNYACVFRFSRFDRMN